MSNDITELARALSDVSLTNDEALLKLCQAMINRMTEMQDMILKLQEQLLECFQNQQRQSEILRMLSEMYHTHFSDEETRH